MSPSSLPPSVLRFQAAAAERGVPVEVTIHVEPARSAEQAAIACGCDLGQIVKSLVFRGEATGEPVLFLVSGRNRVDLGRAAAAAGESIARADADFVRVSTGYAIGGVPPFGHARSARTVMDEDLLRHPVLWAAAGHPNAVFPIAPHDLRSVTGATVMAV